MFRMRQPDGVVRDFVRDADEPNYLVGENPWVGQIEGPRITVMTHPEFKDGRTGFLFEGGRLKLLLLDGKEFKAGETSRPFADSPEALWPADRPSEDELKSEKYDIWLHAAETGRMRFGFANPNKAAAFFVGIALLGLGVCFLHRRIWLLPGMLVFVPAVFCVVKTQSRGGLVALVAGLLTVAFLRSRVLFSVKRVFVLLALVLAFVGFVFVSGTAERYGKGFLKEGASETSRLPIWSEAPRMMVDAPQGWGLGNSGVAYINWYQPQGRFHVVRALLNSHLTWLVEFGWPLRFAYVFGWLLVICCLLRTAVAGGNPVAPAAWVALGVASCFNHVAESPLVWCAPLLFLAGFLIARPWRQHRLLVGPAVIALIGATVILSGLFAWGLTAKGDGTRICGSASQVVVNGNKATCWVVDDDFALHGGYWGMNGKQVRRYYARHPDAPALGYVRSVESLPPMADRLVLAGTSGQAFIDRWRADPKSVCQAKKIIFLSPPFAATSVPEGVFMSFDAEVVQGEFLSELFPKTVLPKSRYKILPNLEVFIPGWVRIALGKI